MQNSLHIDMIHSPLNRIENVIASKDYLLDKEVINLGVSSGRVGLSLFYYYYYLRTKEDWCLDKLMEYLSKSIAGINDQYTGSFIILDMIQVSQFLYFLKEEEIIDDDINEYVEVFDPWIAKFLDLKISEKAIDSYGGVLRAGDYYLTRSKEIDVNSQIDKILTLLEELVIEDPNKKGIYFKCEFDENETIQIGKSHGVTGVIYFLLRLYDSNFFQKRCIKLLRPALEFIIGQMKSEGFNLFPFDIGKTRRQTFNNLNYGDIGVAYTLYHAGRILDNHTYKKKGIETMLNFAKVRDESAKKIFDANLLYGASGVYSVMNLFNSYSPCKEFKEASAYWLKRITDFGKNESQWAGYQTFYNPTYEELQISFDQGIAGIGITLICAELEIPPKYLSFMDYNFL